MAHYWQELARTAARVDAGYPANTALVLEGDKPVLKRRKGVDRRPEAIALEAAIHQRLPERSLLDVLTRAAYLTGWYRHFGPASGSDPKIRDSLGRYVITTSMAFEDVRSVRRAARRRPAYPSASLIAVDDETCRLQDGRLRPGPSSSAR